MNKVFKNTSIYAFGSILPKVIHVLLLPIYTRYLTPEDYGVVSSMQVIQVILAVLLTLTMQRSVFRLYWDYKTEADRDSFISTVNLSIVFISTFILITLFLANGLIQKIFVSIDYYPFYAYAILASYATVFSYIPESVLMIREKAMTFTLLSIFKFIISSALILFFIVVRGEGAAGMLKGSLIAAIISSVLALTVTYKHFKFIINIQMFKSSLFYSLPGIPTMLSAWILNLSDRIFIERYFSLEVVGLYSLGYKLAGLGLIIYSALNMAFSPVFFRLANDEMNQDKSRDQIKVYNDIFVYVLIFITFIIVFFSKEIIFLFIDERYFGAYIITILISIAYMFNNFNSILGRYLHQSKKVVQGMVIDVSTAVLNIILNFLFIPKWGMIGAAYATITSFAFTTIVAYYYTKTYCYFIPNNWKQIVVSLTILSSIVLIFQYYIELSLIYSLVVKLSFIGIVLLILLRRILTYFRILGHILK